MMLLATILLLATLAGADDTIGVCSRNCVLEGSTANYEAGMQYQYQYQGEVITKALVAGEEESRLAVTADIVIAANTPCDLKLQVTSLAVEDTNADSEWFTEAVQEHDLHFSYQHGAITHLCPHEEEAAVATNFKRGILSSLQMTVTPRNNQSDVVVTEVDVSGQCDTKYSIVLEPNLQVTKTKMGCHTSSYIPHLPHSHYTNTEANTQLPFAKSSHTCQMQGKAGAMPRGDINAAAGGGVWETVECNEEVQVHRPLTPGSSESSLATVAVSSKLTLQDGPKPMDGDFLQGEESKKRLSLVADLKAAVEFAEMKKLSTQSVKNQLTSVLESLSESEDPEQDELRPRLFSTLVHLLGHLELDELKAVWEVFTSQDTLRRMLLDGLLVCDGSPCHVLVAELAEEQGTLSPGQLHMWLTGVHMHSSAHPSFVKLLLDLAESQEKAAAAAVLAASSVVHRLCQQQPSNCSSHAQPFLEYVEQQVGDSCGLGETRQEQEQVKLALRAMGNAGILPSDNFPESCYMNRDLPPELRITALQSYRRTTCSGVKAPWKLLEDVRERSEVRVAAYLALVPCAAHTAGFFTRIHKLLQQEEVHQVYSFIWTHVKNLAEHPGPSKHDQEISKLARQYTLPHKFNDDAFRTSGNFHYTHFSEMLNVGGSMDANVVYSQDSYVPQQVSANLTLDLLDNSFNFLDFGGEFSGIESIIENYFGEGGYFANEDVLKLLQNLRPKRNIIHDDKIQEFQKMYDESKDKRKLELEDDATQEEEAKTAFYVRMFGNEILYIDNFLQYRHNPTQLLYLLTQELSSQKMFKILDQEYMTPTLLGFPLRLKINATASVNLQHEHTFHNTKKLGLLLEGSITPAVVAAMDETLVVDAFVSSSGLRRSSTQVAKTTIGGKLSIKDNEVVELHVSVPDSEVIKVSSSVQVALLKGAGKWEEPETALTAEEHHCIDGIEDVVGFKVCASQNHGQYEVDGKSVIAEPSKTEFKVTKTDTFNSYKLYVKRQENMIEALFDTPGSAIDRKIHLLFNINPDHESGYIVIRGVGYGIKGQYKYSEMFSELQLQYLQASKVLGEVEVSLKSQKEGLNQQYAPKFLIAMGSNKFTLEGKLNHTMDEDTKKVEALWEVEGAWHHKESDMANQAFGTASGRFLIGQDEFMVHLNTEYGTEPSQPHSITFTVNNNRTTHRDIKTLAGFTSLQISQIPAGLTVEYEYRPDLFELNTNASLQTTQVSSEVVVKNVMDGKTQDSQLTLSLASQQLNIDYKASGIYKVSESGFQAEAELNFDSAFKSKFLLTYLLEDDPMYLLAGLHLTLNDFVFQIGHNIDMTQPEHLLITLSTTVGEGTAGLYLEADYGSERPFNTSLEVFADVGTQSFGLSSHSASDLQWQNFTGKSTIKWLDWSGSLTHEIVFSETTRALKLSLENGESFELLYETSPNQALKVVVLDALGDTAPIFMMGAEKHISSEHSMLQVNLTAGDSPLVHLGWHMNSENQFNFSLHLLESMLNMDGHYSAMDNGTISGDIQAEILLPSGESVSSDLSVSYVNMENERLLVVSATHEESTVEGQLVVNHGGRFDAEKSGINFTLTTPHPSFQKFEVAFHKSGGAHSPYSGRIELDEFKILGDVQLSDPSNLLLKLEYEGGEECATRLHLEHSHSDQQFLSIASLALTQASEPWELVLNTSFDHSSHQHFLDNRLSIQAPVALMPHPFHFHGMYNVTENQVQFEIQTGLEESISVIYHGKKELSWERHLLSGLGKIEASWMKPLSVNITYDHSLGGLNILLYFELEGDSITSWTAEFTCEYSSTENIKANFYLTYTDLQITMDFVHNQSESNLKQQLEVSINTFTLTYETNLKWNEYLIPTKAEGRLTLFNFLDHSLDLSLSHMEESSAYTTQIDGTFDDYTFGLEHKLEPKESQEGWQDYLKVTMKDVGVTTSDVTLTANTHGDWQAVNSSLKFESPWTDSFNADFVLQEVDSSSSVILESFYGDKSLLSTHIMCGCWPSWEKSDFVLNATSEFFEDFKLKLQHDFTSGNLIFGEVTYGSDVHMQFGSHLKIKETWYQQEFQSYGFNATATITKFNIDFKSLGTIDSNFNGTLKLHWNEYSLSLISSVLDGNIFEAEVKNSETNYQSELKYELGSKPLFSLNFTLLKELENFILFQTVVESAHPKFGTVSTLEFFTDKNSKTHGKLIVTADLTNIDKYSLQGKLEMESNLLAAKEYGGQLDLNINFDNELNWKGLVGVAVHGGEWDVRSGVNTSLEVSQEINFEFGARLHLLYGDQTFDLKDVRALVSAESGGAYEMRMILQPDHTGTPWSLAVIYNHRYGTLKGFLGLGDSGKYELSLRLSSRTLTVDAHEMHEDGSKWQIVEGNINWILKKSKKLITMNMKSDIPSISKITGKLIAQTKRDFAITATLQVNDDQFDGNFRLRTLQPGKSFRVEMKVGNSIIKVFESEVAVEFTYSPNSFACSLKIGLNEKPDWIEGNLKFSAPESYLTLRTPLSFLETFNITVRTKTSESYGFEMAIEAPQFCWNLAANVDKTFLHASLNLNLDLLCNKDSLFDFKLQYNISKNPVGILCELNVANFDPLFKFNTTGNLTPSKSNLQVETVVYPQRVFGASLAFESGDQNSVRLHAYDPPSNETYFTFELLLFPSKAELTLDLPEGKSFLIKANYDFQNKLKKFNSTMTNSLFDYDLNAKIDGEASVGGEEGIIEMSFTSNTALTHLNVTGMYSFSEELKDLSFKILSPKGNADGEVRVLQDEDFLDVKGDMTSSLHTFHKYHLEVKQTTENAVEKLMAMLTQDDNEYHMISLKKFTGEGTERNLNVSLPFKFYEHFSADYIRPNDASGGTYRGRLNLKSYDETYMVEASHEPNNFLYQLLFNWTCKGDEYKNTITYSAPSNGHQVEIVLDVPPREGNPVNFSVILKYNQDGLASAVFYTPHGLLGFEGTWIFTETTIVLSATAHLSLFHLGEIDLDMTIPLQASEHNEIKMMWLFPDWKIEMWLNTGDHLKTGSVGLLIYVDGESKAYSLTYDFKDAFKLEGQFEELTLNTTWVLKGTQIPISAGQFEVRSNLPGYEAIDGSWEVGYRNWQYYGKATLDVKHQELLSVNTSLDTLSEGASYPWQNVRLNILLESPFTAPHHLHAEYQLHTPQLLLYYQHGLDTFKIQLNSDFRRNSATLALTGNVPVEGISSFDVNVACNFLDSYSASVVVKVEDSTLEQKFDFSSDWRVGSVQLGFTSPFLKPGNAQLSWSLVPSSINLKGFFNLGEHSAKIKMSLENTKSSANFDCHITTSMKELSQFIINLSYKVPGNNNFDVSLATRMNNNGLLMKSSLDTKGGKLLLKFQGTFEIVGNRGSLEVDVGPSDDGYSGSVVGKFPGYKRFFIDLYFDSYQLKLNGIYDAKEIFVVSVTYSQTKIYIYWTDYWSLNLTTRLLSKGRKYVFRLTFSGFGIDPIELEASYSQRQNHILKVSLTSSQLPSSTLQVTYSDNKVTARVTVGEKTYTVSGGANLRRLQSSFDARFESSDQPNNPIVMQVEYDLTDFFVGRMQAAKKLAQITVKWEEKLQVNVTGLRSSNMAKIDLKAETPLQSLPHLHLGFHGEFFFTEFVGFNCTAFAEWSERIEVTAVAKLMQANINVECTLMTSFISIEKVSASLKLQPGQLQLSAQYNDDTWKAVWDYQFTPFSVTCSIETPITNFETASFVVSVSTNNEKIAAEFQLIWPEEQRLGVQIEVEKWQVELYFQTPWEPFTNGLFTAALKTEGEELMLSSTLQLDRHKAEVSLILLLPTNFKFMVSYSENSVTIGMAELEYSQRGGSMRISLGIQTPFKNLESLEALLQYGDNKISLMFKVNEVMNILEGMYSGNGGEFKADIPLLSNFSWALKAENTWLKAETNAALKLADKFEPLTASLKYDIDPEAKTFKSMFSVVHDKELASVDVNFGQGLSFMAKILNYILDLQVSAPSKKSSVKFKLEAPELDLESFVVNLSVMFDDISPTRLDAVLLISVKWLGEDPDSYKIQGTLDLGERNVLTSIKFEGNDVPSYEVNIEIARFEIGLQITLTENRKELFSLYYNSGPFHNLFLPQKLVIRAPVWESRLQLLLTLESFTASLTLPHSSEHSLIIRWPQQLSREELRITAALKSPYILQEDLQLTFTISVPEDFYGKMDLDIVFGEKDTHVRGEYKYDESLGTFKAALQIASNHVGDFSFRTNVQWRRDIFVTASLAALEEEHSLRFHLDGITHAIELMLESPLLPGEKITFTGEISKALDLSHMTFISKLQAGDQEIEFEARFESEQQNHIDSYAVLRKNSQDIFSISLKMLDDSSRTDFVFSMDLLLDKLENSVSVRYYDADWGRYLSGFFRSHMLTEQIKLEVFNTHVLRDLQSFNISGPNFKFFAESNVNGKSGQIIAQLGYDEIDLFVSGDIFEDKQFGIQLKSTFVNCEVLSLYAIWSNPDRKEMAAQYAGNGEVILFNGNLWDDDLFRYSIDVTLKTSYEGYEKFSVFTPRHRSGSHTKALLEYPGRKIGVDVNLNYQDIFNSDFTISLYLPCEDFGIISLKYIMNTHKHNEIEARIGKIGLTLSSVTERLISGLRIETVTSLNEYYGKSILHVTYAKSKRMVARYNYTFEPKELTDLHSFHGKIFYEANDRIFLVARDNKEELVKFHIAWGEDKILTLVTPKLLPGYVHVNLECGSLRDDYRFEFGLLTADRGAWSVYGVQLHKEVLPAGHHLSLLGRSGEYIASIAGTLSVNPHHFNNSLVFALNKNKMGYKTLLLSEPGFFSRRYTSDIQLLLHNRTLHHYTSATVTIKCLQLLSSFTWNKNDEHMPPIIFSMDYTDDYFFRNKKFLSAVLRHPDIKDITLQADITRTHNSSLHGSAEFVDENFPEMKLVATMEVEPMMDDGRHTVSLSLSQPVSNFSILMETQLRQDPLNEALCRLSYYSLTSETWHQVNLSASLESQGSGHALTVAVLAPEKEWGRTWRGAVDSRPEEASLSLEGSSLELGDTWKLGSVVKRHLPELVVYLSVGKELEVYEEARVRLGLHSPVEAGAALDHLSFGEWYQDAALGLRLTSPHVLQAFLDFDPSLDYKDHQDWAQMFSPTMEVIDVWKRDTVAAVQNLEHWATTEAPAVMEVLINNGTIQAIWQREASNWDYFLKDVEDTYQGIAEDFKTLWESFLIPVYEAVRDYTIEMYEAAQSYLTSVKDSVKNFLKEALQWLQDAWQVFQTEFSSIEAYVRGQLEEWWDTVGQGASTFWTDLLQWFTWFGETLKTEAISFYEKVKTFFITHGETVMGFLSDTFQAIKPYFEGLPQAFQSYGQEVWLEFSGPCWMAITDKRDSLITVKQNLDSGVRVVTEFMQVEKYSHLLLQATDWLKENLVNMWSTIKETTIQAGQDLLQAFSSWSPPLTEFASKAWASLSQLPTQVSAEGLYPLMVNMIGDLQEKVSEMSSQLPVLLRESIEPLRSYLNQFIVFKHIDDAMTGVYVWAESAWQKWISGQHTNLGFMEQQLFLLGDAIRDYLTTTNYFLNQIFVFEPSVLGHVVYNQYLPGHWTSFMELPSSAFPTHLFKTESAATEAERLTAAALPNPSLLQAITPSYTATAVIAGQHVTTFDLQHYQFLGSCSYLLAKDFEGGDFEVFGVYESEAGATRLKSVVVHSQNTDVTLNVDGSVASMGNYDKVHNSTDYSALKLPDLFVSCSRTLCGCALTVSGKYFGRLGGLLGNYNGDASDDMFGPGGQVAHDAAHLATMWAISPTPCYQANQANIVEDYNDVEEESVRECSRLFLYGNSPLSDCFHAVDPLSYFTHCIHGNTHPAFSEHDLNSPCTAVSSYRTQCWTRHIHLPDLDKCKNGSSTGCVLEGKEVSYGWSQVYEETSHGSADMAVIVELTDCNAGRDMASLFDYITRQLERNNINDVRYSVVAVGEDKAVTKSFLTKSNTTDFLNTLTFSGVTPVENIEAVVASTASGLEWRPGVSRSIVHIGCQACERGDEATEALHQNDVTYHLVSSLEVEMSGTSNEAQARKRKLFGFDENLVYTPADFKSYRGSEKLRLALRGPKGGCVATALSTGGSVFDSNKWTPRRAIQTKKFLSVLAKRVVVSSSPPKCQECHCLKEDSRTVPTCFKCFGNSLFLITQVGNGASAAAKDDSSVTNDIKRSFQENFLKSNSNTTMLRRIL